MPARIYLSNDADGQNFVEDEFHYSWVSETSAHGLSATLLSLCGPMTADGEIVDVVLGVVRPALSASGFVSGTVDFDVKINSATCLSVLPAIAMVATSATAVRVNTNGTAAAATPATINTGSNRFSAGDQICVNYNARSVGSAAAGAAGIGLYAVVKVRYNAD